MGQEGKEGRLDQRQGLSHPSYKPAPAGRARCESIPGVGTTTLDQVGATAVGASRWEPPFLPVASPGGGVSPGSPVPPFPSLIQSRRALAGCPNPPPRAASPQSGSGEQSRA